MVKAFKQLAETYKVTQTKIDTEKGLLLGYSHALGSRVIMAYSPERGIHLWYKYDGQCQDCEKQEECRLMIKEEAERLGIKTLSEEDDLPPAKLAEIVFTRAWPEAVI